MTIIYRTDGPWGAGKGSNLEALEVDGNFYDLDQRVIELEEDPPAGVGVADIQVINNELFFYLTDGSEFGPFPLPEPLTTVDVQSEVSSFTLTASHVAGYVRVSSADSVVITCPDDTQDPDIPIGSILTIRGVGVGTVTFAAGGSATINTPETLTLRKQHSTATLVKVAANTWDLSGDLLPL